MRANKKPPLKSDKTQTTRGHKRGVVGYSRKTALLEEAITQMNAGKYGRSSTALKELLALDPQNMEARRLFATLHLRLGSLIPARQAFDALISEAYQRQDYWLAESLLREYLAAGPRCVPFLEKLGALYQEKGDALEAVAEYGKAIDILIEDPDPDNPQHAAQLYTKIRELAPASPVAFRLASFFDAQTGELLAPESSDSGTSPLAPSPDISMEGQGIQAGPEPMNGVMPWEIQDARVVAPDSLNTAEISASSGALLSQTLTDFPVQEGQRIGGEVVPSDLPLGERIQSTSGASEVGSDPTEETRSYECASAPSRSQTEDLPGQIVPGDSDPFTVPSLSVGDFVAAQEQDRGVAEIEPRAADDQSSSSSAVASKELTTASEALPSLIQPTEDTCVPSLSQMEEQAELAVESSETQLGSGELVSTAGPQQQDGWVAEIDPRAPYDVSGPSMVSIPTEPPHTSEPPPSSMQSVEAASVLPVAQSEETAAPAFLGAEPLTAEPIDDGDKRPLLLQPVETEPKEVVTEQPPGTCSPSSSDPGSVNEIAEPWKHPGFSWESVFNRAWKFGSDPSPPASPSEFTQTSVEKTTASASAESPLQEHVFENQAVEIPEREASSSLEDQTSSGAPIAPMPWDQVEESVISIPPVQTAQPIAESPVSTVDRSTGESDSDSVPKVGEAQAQPPPSADLSAAETDSFSMVQTPQTLASPDPDISAAVDLGHTAFEPEKASAPAEPEPQFRVVSILTPNESSTPEAPRAAIESPVFEMGPVSDDLIAPSEVQAQRADFALTTDDDRVVAVAQSVVQEPEVEPSTAPSQSVCEAQSQTIDEIPLSSPLPAQPRIWEPLPETVTTPHLTEETTKVQTHERQPQAMAGAEAQTPIPEPVPEPAPEQEEWVKTGESIRFIEQPQAAPVAQVSPVSSERQDVGRSMSVAAAAVDVLFESSRNAGATETCEQVAEAKPSRKTRSALIRARLTITSFVSSCFSTTRAIVMTCVGMVMLSGILIALGVGAVGLIWVIMEESPSPLFQSLTTTPQRTLSDFKKNGYFFLLGIDASAGHDPVQAGYDRKPDVNKGNDSTLACFGSSGSRGIEGSNASANVMRGWVRSSDPVGRFKSNQEAIKGWGSQHQLMLDRYSQWQKLPFEDWGYGQTVSLPCAAMVFAHQLHVADGFLQSTDLGVDRLETDMEAWRIVLSQAKTLSVKMLALQAINDDIAVASGLLVHPDFEGKHLGRVSKILRPFDQGELSLRWPMQSELVAASKAYETQLKAARSEEQAMHTMVVAALPLPMQRRLNDYAEYYDASYKAASEGKYGSLPKWKTYIHFPASGLMDYFTNPIENIVGLEPLAPWDLYNGFVVDTEAHLRLASLQAWLRRGPAEGDLVTRIAKAGQNFYDPYTGLPMLVNMKKGALYSVGHDGKDQDADPQSDVVVEIPAGHVSAAPTKPSAASSKSR